jgi:hypothetical protein
MGENSPNLVTLPHAYLPDTQHQQTTPQMPNFIIFSSENQTPYKYPGGIRANSP